MEEEVLDRTVWRTRVGRGYEPVVVQTKQWINEIVRRRVVKKSLFLFAVFTV